MDKFSLYAGQFLSFREHFAPKGHNACAGCGVALAVRHVYKALDGKVDDIEKASWQIPWEQNLIVGSDTGAQPALLTISKGDNGEMLQICFDNEAMGKKNDTSVIAKKLPAVAAASGYQYAATACPSHPFDLIDKVRKAWEAEGSAFILVLCPCPVAWGFEPENTVQIGRLAVETRTFPLYEIASGYYSITIDEQNARPVRDYLARQDRFAAVKGKKAEALQAEINNAFAALKDKSKINA